MSDITSLGLWIKHRRKALDLTQDELARRVGCSLETIRKIEGDARRPSREIAGLLADRLELLADERVAFIQAARAELGADRLAPPTQSIARGAFVPPQATPSVADAPEQPRIAPPTNLPTPPTALIGREREIEQIVALLRKPSARLVTLTGPGGTGKTRLGLQVATELLEEFLDSVYFVDLAPLREPRLVIGAIAQTLGMREIGGQPLLAQLKQFLGDKHLLLLLDNFEHLLDAAPLLAELLAAAPRLKLLVTSRQVLHLRGEREVTVPPLALPDRAALPTLKDLAQYDAIALFTERALDTKPDFQITSANAATVAEICARLDGLPLAIELAAARLKLFTPQALLGRLDERLTFLTGGARDLPERQQTMRTTIDWSYHLLNACEQTLFARLAVFVGGCTLDAVERVLRPEDQGMSEDAPDSVLGPQPSVLDGLAALLDKSLLRQIEVPGGTARFVMLETIREYALERLEASGEAEQLRRRHATYFLSLVEADPDLQAGPARVEQLKTEHDNLRAALAWSQTAANAGEIGLRLASAMETFWITNGYWNEARGWMAAALMHSAGLDRERRADGLWRMGQLLALQGEYAAGHVKLDESLQLYRELGDTSATAGVLERLGWLAREQNDLPTAQAYLAESLELYRALGQKDEIATVLNTLGELAVVQEDAESASALLEESQAINQEPVNRYVHGWTLNHLGHVAQLQREYQHATQLHEQSLALFQCVGSHWTGTANALHCLGETALAQHNLDAAQAQFRAALAQFHDLGDPAGISWNLAGLGSAAALDEEPERAARLWGAAARLRQSIGCRPAPAARATYERAMAAARDQLGARAFAAAWAAGQALTLEQAIAEALGPG